MTTGQIPTEPFRLEITDAQGERSVVVDKTPFSIGRRETNALRLAGSEVSREHVVIEAIDGVWVVRDLASRYGTLVNDTPLTTGHKVKAGDRIRLGRGGGADMVCMFGQEGSMTSRSMTGARDDLRHITALLEDFRSMGSGRVLQEVLTLVLDAAVEISGAERAFIMLAGVGDELEFKLGRGRGKVTLNDATFGISRKIPEEVFRLGETQVMADLLDGALADVHQGTVALGIRNVVCLPLNAVLFVDREHADTEDSRIGVLYLDSREKGTLLSTSTRKALAAMAAEASQAIQNAQLYRDKLEKTKLEHEISIAAEIQQALMPKPLANLRFAEAAAASIACRSIGGDFFDYLDFDGKALGFTLGDVAGKGPPAALLSALMQGMFASHVTGVDGTAALVTIANKVLCKRGIESRFVTLMFGILEEDGTLTYTNAGHNPPFVVSASGVRRLDQGGPVVGLLEFAPYDQETLKLETGDTIIVFSDGVSEAMDADGDELGDDRLLEAIQAAKSPTAEDLVEKVFAAVKEFTHGTAQGDDITAMVIKYRGPDAA